MCRLRVCGNKGERKRGEVARHDDAFAAEALLRVTRGKQQRLPLPARAARASPDCRSASSSPDSGWRCASAPAAWLRTPSRTAPPFSPWSARSREPSSRIPPASGRLVSSLVDAFLRSSFCSGITVDSCTSKSVWRSRGSSARASLVSPRMAKRFAGS